MPIDKAVDSAVLDANLLSVADAIRAKAGTSEEMAFPDGFVEAIGAIESGGGDNFLEKMLSGEMFEFKNNCESIADYALYYNQRITSISVPNATEIGQSAFSYIPNCKSVFAPLLTKIPSRFVWNTPVTTVELGKCKEINTQAFRQTKLQAYPDLSETTRILDYAFSDCPTILTTHLYLPAVVEIGMYVFDNNVALELVDCEESFVGNGITPPIRNHVFRNCASLKTLILRAGKVLSMQNINAFTGTPFASGGTGGTVYVPASLVEEYKTATNWATLYAAGTCNFVAIEGSEYE